MNTAMVAGSADMQSVSTTIDRWNKTGKEEWHVLQVAPVVMLKKNGLNWLIWF